MSGTAGSPDPDLAFFVLGPLRAERQGVELALGPAKHRLVLATLLLEANHVVTVEALIDSVWESRLEGRPEATLQVYISALRKSLAQVAGVTSTAPISTWGSGYQIAVGKGRLDLWAVDEARVQAEAELNKGDPALASRILSSALALWRGPSLSDLPSTTFVQTVRAALDEKRLDTLERRIAADLAAGRHHELVAELQQLAPRVQTREGVWASLMLALYRSGRQAEALDAYATLRGSLAEDLGIEPNPALQQLHQQILQQSAELDWDAGESRQVAFDPMATIREPSQQNTSGSMLERASGERVPLTHLPFVIGRAEDCDLVIDDPRVSRRHAQLVASEGGLALIDLGSTNGTIVDGDGAPFASLRPGAVIKIGSEELILCPSTDSADTA